jgi:hypothetical protein
MPTTLPSVSASQFSAARRHQRRLRGDSAGSHAA